MAVFAAHTHVPEKETATVYSQDVLDSILSCSRGGDDAKGSTTWDKRCMLPCPLPIITNCLTRIPMAIVVFARTEAKISKTIL